MTFTTSAEEIVLLAYEDEGRRKPGDTELDVHTAGVTAAVAAALPVFGSTNGRPAAVSGQASALIDRRSTVATSRTSTFSCSALLVTPSPSMV